MNTFQHRTLLVVATAAAALLALVFGVSAGRSIADADDETSATVVDDDREERPRTTAPPEDDDVVEPTTTTTTVADPAPDRGPEPDSKPGPEGDPEDEPAPERERGPQRDPEPEPQPDEAVADCDAPHGQGSWSVDGPGNSVAVDMVMAPFTGPCAGVTLALDEPASDVFVERISLLNVTTVRFAGTGPHPGPVGNDVIDFAGLDDRITKAVVTSTEQGIGLTLYHPSGEGEHLGARVDIDGNFVTISVREQVPGDPASAGSFEGEPYQLHPRGPIWDGLFIDIAIEPEASGWLNVQGYAKAPESVVEFGVFSSGPFLQGPVCDAVGMTAGAPWHFSRFRFECQLDPGEYVFGVGWTSPSGDPADDVWYFEEISIA